MNLKVTDERAWYLWMLAGLLVGVALSMTAGHVVHHIKTAPLSACFSNVCFS